MPGGRKHRQKGDRAERGLVDRLQDAGIAAERTPLSGSARGRFGGYDIVMPMLGKDCKVEVKHHGDGFVRLYKWLEPVDLLMVRADRSEPLVVMELATFIALVHAAEGNK